MCYTVLGGVIDDEFGKRIGDIGIQKTTGELKEARGYDFALWRISLVAGAGHGKRMPLVLPAMCSLDYTMSEAGNASNFVRGYTLASGGPYCDCGYKLIPMPVSSTIIKKGT